MPRFDVHPTGPSGTLVIDVQADLLDDLSSRVVVPLLPKPQAPPSMKGLNPTFDLGGAQLVMVTQMIAAVPVKLLRAPVASLRQHQDEITKALDVLLTGY